MSLLQENGTIIELRDYLTHPLSHEELKALTLTLDLRPYALVRVNDLAVDDVYPQPEDDEGWLSVLNKNPRLLQRPIVGYNGKVMIARPPEMVLDLF